jgi:DNA polymerase-3 subunit gamma/tau
MRLFEQYAPTDWSDVVGQDAIVKKVLCLKRRGLAGRAYWISGRSGQGKSTIAWLIAHDIADDMSIYEHDARTMTAHQISELERQSRQPRIGKGGVVHLVNESHGLDAECRDQLLVTLDTGRIPKHAAWIFTTTEQQKMLIKANPLLSRCHEFSLANDPPYTAFAKRCQQIAIAESLDGKPFTAYEQLAVDTYCNMRTMLERIEQGDMLD